MKIKLLTRKDLRKENILKETEFIQAHDFSVFNPDIKIAEYDLIIFVCELENQFNIIKNRWGTKGLRNLDVFLKTLLKFKKDEKKLCEPKIK